MNKIYKDSIDITDNIIIEKDDNRPKGTRITFIDDATGEVLRTEENSMVIAGGQLTACSHYGIEPAVILPNYNTELGIENMVVKPSEKVQEIAYLFCCGTSGCGTTASEVYPVKYHSWINPPVIDDYGNVDEEKSGKGYLIPFRYEDIENDLNATARKIYFGRKEYSGAGKVAYWYKAFDSQPQVFLEFADGTQIDSNVYASMAKQRSYVKTEVRLKITKSDFRDWFFTHDGIENARVNTMSILTAWKYTDPETGLVYYNNVRPLTRLNFTNEWLIDLTKSITIVYETFY